MKLGAHDYLIQQNFDASDGKCELALPGGPPPPPPPGGLKITVTNPANGSVIHAGGALDFVASVTGSATVSSATVNWVAPSGTTTFTMAKNASRRMGAGDDAVDDRARRHALVHRHGQGRRRRSATSSTVTLTVQ